MKRWIVFLNILFTVNCGIMKGLTHIGNTLTSLSLREHYAEISKLPHLEIDTVVILPFQATEEINRKKPELSYLIRHDFINALRNNVVVYEGEKLMEETEYNVFYANKSGFEDWFFANPTHKLIKRRKSFLKIGYPYIAVFISHYNEGWNLSSAWIEMYITITGKDAEVYYTSVVRGFYLDVLKLIKKKFLKKEE